MKIALIQLNSAWEDKQTNFDRVEKFIEQAAQEDCDIVVLPEMFNTGFSRNLDVIAEDEHGKTASFLSEMAIAHHIHIIAGYAERAFGDLAGRNVAAIYDRSGALIAKYTKIHPFSHAKEDQYFMPGNRIVSCDIEGIKASVFICYDLRFPEIFRVVAREVHMVFIIANWPSARKAHWETLLKARAIENQCFVIGVNRIGIDGYGLEYPGLSHVFDPNGNDLCAGNGTDEFLTAECSPEDVHTIRASFPVLHDMHPITLDLLLEK